MAINDYLLTRLGLRASERERELQLERERAAREAKNRAAWAQLLPTAVSAAGTAAQLGMQEAAKQEGIDIETAMQEGAARADEIGASEFTRQGDREGVRMPGRQEISAEEFYDGRVPSAAERDLSQEEIQAELARALVKPDPLPEADVVAGAPYTRYPAEVPPAQPKRFDLPPPDALPTSDDSVGKDMFNVPDTRPALIRPRRPEAQPGDTVQQMIYSLDPAAAGVANKYSPEDMPSREVPSTGQFPAEQGPAAVVSTPAPAPTPTAAKPEAPATTPKAVAEAQSKAAKITGFRPPEFRETTDALAEKIVAEVWERSPTGNPITDFFATAGRNPRTRALAVARTKSVIAQTRRQAVATAFNRWQTEQSKNGDLAAVKLQIAQAQALAAASRAESAKAKAVDAKVKDITLKSADRNDLLDGQGFLRDTNRLVQLGRQAIKDGGLPIGAARQAAMAYNEALAARKAAPAVTSQGAQFGGQGGVSAAPAGVGVSGGASGSKTGSTMTPTGGPVLDAETFDKAWAKIDMNNMTESQKAFMSQLKLVIQRGGKTREGKSLTDRDLTFYMDNLINTADPKVAMRQINNLIEDAQANYGLKARSIGRSIGSDPDETDEEKRRADPMWEFYGLARDADRFTFDDIAAAQESDFSATQQWIEKNRPTYSSPGDVPAVVPNTSVDEHQKLRDEQDKLLKKLKGSK